MSGPFHSVSGGGDSYMDAHLDNPQKENTMRELTSHKINPANDVLSVTAIDGPGPGGASHAYNITQPGKEGFPTQIVFQNGAISEVGVNGVTHEALLAILIDRMEGFQSGAFANAYNEAALGFMRAAQNVLLDRTRERMSRGVEGTHKV